MEMLWFKSLEIGIPAIDDQHKELFRRIEMLLDTDNAGHIPETLKFLGDYVEKHFSDEQGIHRSVQYPKAEPHKKMHANFVDVFNKMESEYETEGKKMPVLIKINKTVIDWLKSHIMVHDKEFAAYYKEREEKKASK